MTYSDFHGHSSPLFKNLGILKCIYLIVLNSVFFYVCLFYSYRLPHPFSEFFNEIHNYNTRLASKETLYLSSIRSNSEIVSLRFTAKIWNGIKEEYNFFKILKSIRFPEFLLICSAWLIYNYILTLLYLQYIISSQSSQHVHVAFVTPCTW